MLSSIQAAGWLLIHQVSQCQTRRQINTGITQEGNNSLAAKGADIDIIAEHTGQVLVTDRGYNCNNSMTVHVVSLMHVNKHHETTLKEDYIT